MTTVSADLRALLRPIDSLREDPANARVHDEPSIAAIARSLERFGQRKPIVVDASGKVLAGNGTLRAARRLGWTEIAATVGDGLADPDAIGFALADNRTAELSRFDPAKLRAAIGAAGHVSADTALGLDEHAVRAIIRADNARMRALKDKPITVAARPDHVDSKAGEIYHLGPHRLLCGDSTDAAQVARLFDDGAKAALFATDPPYLIGYKGGVGTGDGHRASTVSGRKDWGELSPDKKDLDPTLPAARSGARRGKDWTGTYHEGAEDGDATGFHQRYATAARPHLRDDAAWYCWHADARADHLARAWAELGVYWHMTVIWVKPTFVMGGTMYHYQHEPCAMGWVRPKMPRRLGQGNESSVWALGWGEDGTAAKNVDCPDHPTARPLGVWRIPMLKHTEPGDLCYEPFGGSGSQLIAAATLGRVCRTVELEPVFCDVIRRRWTAWARAHDQDPGPGALEPEPDAAP